MKNHLTEFLGTFFLVLTIGLSVLNQVPFPPLVIGSVLMVMVYMGGHVSGAHYNPAVTFAIFLRGKLAAAQIVPYMIAQVAGATAAGGVVYLFKGCTFAPSPGDGVTFLSAVAAEVLLTFALCLVILNVATARGTEGNSFYGLAIGFTVMVGAATVGPISGGAFNPAVGLGPILINAIIGGGGFADLPVYLVGPFLGGALAAIVFRMQGGVEPETAP